MAAPIYDKLNIYKNSGVYPFHMPGHKRQAVFGDTFSTDITEIDGFDNLHKPQGIIMEAQRLAAKTFGAKESFFLINGASCGIIASILMAVKDGEQIIVGRNCHKSVFDALVLCGGKPIYIMPKRAGKYPVLGAVDASDIAEAISKNPEAKAVIITSPTYEGIVSDVSAIAEIAHKSGIMLIVDEAHGAHFKFNNIFPKTALAMGADIVVQSLHKTLPSPTQTAIIHVSGDMVEVARLKKCLTIVQSSSPSYIFMGAIDRCREYLDNGSQKDFAEYAKKLLFFRNALSKLKKITLMDNNIVGKDSVLDLDLGKIVLFSDYCDLREVADKLRNIYKIEVEMACPTHIIAMTSVSDTKEAFSKFATAMSNIEKEMAFGENINSVNFLFPMPKVIISPRVAFNADLKEVEIENAKGCVCGEFVVAYPPGIPLISPGEEITEEIVADIKKYKNCNINVTGMAQNMLEKIVILR